MFIGAVAINNNKVISIHTGGKVINASAQKAAVQKPTVQKTAGTVVRQPSAASSISSQTITTSTGKSGEHTSLIFL